MTALSILVLVAVLAVHETFRTRNAKTVTENWRLNRWAIPVAVLAWLGIAMSM